MDKRYNTKSEAEIASQNIIDALSIGETNTAIGIPTSEYFSIILPNTLLEGYNAADDSTKKQYFEAYKTAIKSSDFATTFTNIVNSWA